jgi:hypothetical protein
MSLRAPSAYPNKPGAPLFGPLAGNIGGVVHYFFPWTQGPGATAAAITINQWSLFPMYLPGLTITKVCCELTVAGVGNARIAIWDSDALVMPSNLLVDSGDFSVNVATGILENTVAAFTFPDRPVWIGINANVAATFRTGTINSMLLMTSGTDFQGVRRGVARALAYGAPPNPFGTPFGTNFGGPLLAVKQ